jgi:hypothetical protein
MNPVEIEEAVSKLADAPYDAGEFAFAFLEAFGAKPTTLKRLRAGDSNKSDLGGVCQASNVHIVALQQGRANAARLSSVAEAMAALRASTLNTKHKLKFIIATDGDTFEAEELGSDEPPLVCAFQDIHNHFGYFLALAGISTVRQIRDSAFDIKATGRLNRLYLELLKENPDWGAPEKRPDLNHFMARLIFCFFAEDTDIFNGTGLFTATINQMSAADGSDTHEVAGEIFRAMNIDTRHQGQLDNRHRKAAGIKPWADAFPYVNGGLFSGSTETPKFSKIARRYLINIGDLNWKQINPDIFGSMIQAVADDEERGSLGMHYTSVPNILKVLNPLFLDDLAAKLEEAGDNARKLLNLRTRMAHIRVFDPACGSGNFLVIAYKQMRALEAEINQRRNEAGKANVIPLTNFRGIEIKDFPAEIARLALIIAEYQCDVTYRGQQEAFAAFLPLDKQNWITCGNALRLDWLTVCPPGGTGVKLRGDDLFATPLVQTQIDFENVGGETYICGNPPYLGSNWQTSEQKSELQAIFGGRTKSWQSLDYVAGWFMKAADYGTHTPTVAAFVSTNSICQGRQVPTLWPLIFATGHEIAFAHTSFKWANLASFNAGVTVAIVAISNNAGAERRLFAENDNHETVVKTAPYINAYLVPAANVLVEKAAKPLSGVSEMNFGNMPNEGGKLLLTRYEVQMLSLTPAQEKRFIRRIYGSAEFIRGLSRYCLWIEDQHLAEALGIEPILKRIEAVRVMRSNSQRATTKVLAETAHAFGEVRQIGSEQVITIPAITSENRDYLPSGLLQPGTIISNKCYGIYDAPLWNMALIASRVHWVWIATVCVRMRTDFSYSNTLGWNTFPVPQLTEKNRADLTACAESILLAREAHFPATIADLYAVKDGVAQMPENLRLAHEKNDETLERIYIGRRFKNDTERLEKLFEMYTKMTKGKVA